MKFYNNFDLFGSQILFRFHGKQYYKTPFGTSLTFALCLIIVIRLAYIIQTVYERSEPIVIFKERQVDSPKGQVMNNSTFNFAFGMEDPVTFDQFIDPSIYTIKMQQFSMKVVFNETTGANEDVWNNRKINVDRCRAENFQNGNTKDYFLQLKYQNMYCIDPKDQVWIEGDFNADAFQYFTIRVMKCLGPNCSSPQKLDQMLLKGFFSFYFADVIVDPVIKDNPFKDYSRDLYWMTSVSQPRDVGIYFRNNYVQSDYGWVQEDLNIQRSPQFSTTEDQVIPIFYFLIFFYQFLFSEDF